MMNPGGNGATFLAVEVGRRFVFEGTLARAPRSYSTTVAPEREITLLSADVSIHFGFT